MRFREIQMIAKGMGINTYRAKKIELIHSIQKRENNIDCYGTERVDSCGEEICLWRSDCLAQKDNGKSQ